jgi:hypothetical protein
MNLLAFARAGSTRTVKLGGGSGVTLLQFFEKPFGISRIQVGSGRFGSTCKSGGGNLLMGVLWGITETSSSMTSCNKPFCGVQASWMERLENYAAHPAR